MNECANAARDALFASTKIPFRAFASPLSHAPDGVPAPGC